MNVMVTGDVLGAIAMYCRVDSAPLVKMGANVLNAHPGASVDIARGGVFEPHPSCITMTSPAAAAVAVNVSDAPAPGGRAANVLTQRIDELASIGAVVSPPMESPAVPASSRAPN